MVKNKKQTKAKQPKQPILDKIKLLEQISEFNSDLTVFTQPQMVLDLFKHIREKYPEYKKIIPNPQEFKKKLIEVIEDALDEDQEEVDEMLTEKVEYMKVEDKNLMNLKLAQSYKTQKTEKTEIVKIEIPKNDEIKNESDTESKKRLRDEPLKEQRKKIKTYASENRPNARFSDFGGIDSILKEINDLIIKPFSHPEIYKELGVDPPRGILLNGAPGTGKTLLANAIAGELNVPFLKISAPEIVSGMSGDSEKKIRNLFKEAVELAPSVIFIDEIDAIIVKREESNREMEVRMVAQLLTCMDDLSLEKTGGKMVCVIGATNRPDSLDAALRRAGRFDKEISIGMPDVDARESILRKICEKLKLSGEFDYPKIAKATPGFVGADLQALATEAAGICVNRIYEENNISVDKKDPLSENELSQLSILMNDFERAIKKVQPSAMREGFVTIPNVTWDDIGSLKEIREELELSIVEPINEPENFKKLGLNSPSGVLLFGPPGNGKTLLAKAIANECGANFISVKGPELLNKYVGESEKAVRVVFQRARASHPCIIFFDELDALCPRRGADNSNSSTERVVNQLLTEMDGVESRKMVYVVAATNRPDIIDPAMLRPGRLDKLLFVPLPNEKARLEILKTVSRKTPLNKDINLKSISKSCELFSGADIQALVKEAAICCYKEQVLKKKNQMKDDEDEEISVKMKHFQQALKKVSPSVSEKDIAFFEKLRQQFNRQVLK
eukprot:gene11702-4936_t